MNPKQKICSRGKLINDVLNSGFKGNRLFCGRAAKTTRLMKDRAGAAARIILGIGARVGARALTRGRARSSTRTSLQIRLGRPIRALVGPVFRGAADFAWKLLAGTFLRTSCHVGELRNEGSSECFGEIIGSRINRQGLRSGSKRGHSGRTLQCSRPITSLKMVRVVAGERGYFTNQFVIVRALNIRVGDRSSLGDLLVRNNAVTQSIEAFMRGLAHAFENSAGGGNWPEF
jgi:hypothetical protein